MSAREELIASLWLGAFLPNECEQLADAFRDEILHEAAEKIRATCNTLYGSPNALWSGIWADEVYGLLDAADLIDPEVGS